MASILIIDDEESIRSLVSAVLCEKHQVLEASNGQEGQQLSRDRRPDLIITDLNMPKLSGIEMIRNIRTADAGVKIIAMSAQLDCELEREQVMIAGANRCLSKPFTINALEKTVEGLLLKKQAAFAQR
jgi:DNA-binding response OmpR family regulator